MSITLVHQVPAVLPSGGGSSHSVTITATTLGNTLVALFSGNASAITNKPTAVTCGAQSFTKLVASPNPAGGTAYCDIWVLANVAAGQTTVTGTGFANYTGATDCVVAEFSGMPTTITQDGTAVTATGRSNAIASGNMATTGTPLLLLTGVQSDGAITATGNSFTDFTLTGLYNGNRFSYKIIDPATAGNQASSYTTTNSFDRWSMALVGLDGTGGGGSPQIPARPFPGLPLSLLVA